MVIGNMKERRKANRKKLCYVLILKIVFSEIICIRLFSLIKCLKVLFTGCKVWSEFGGTCLNSYPIKKNGSLLVCRRACIS